MKKLFLLAFAAFAFAACSDNDGSDKKTNKVISFESNEALVDPAGKRVTLGDIEVVGGSAAGTHSNVFWAKGGSFTSLMNGTIYDGILCATANKNVSFGTYFSADTGYGDFWGGFVISANYGKTATSLDYKNQFTAWTDRGANATQNCMIGYDCSYAGGPVYARPTIHFEEACAVSYLYLANTAISYTYEPTEVTPDAYYYKIVVVGSIGGKETKRAECVLINGANKAKDWVKVDISALGTVDKLEFIPDSNDANANGLLAPAYFALDEIGYEEI